MGPLSSAAKIVLVDVQAREDKRPTKKVLLYLQHNYPAASARMTKKNTPGAVVDAPGA